MKKIVMVLALAWAWTAASAQEFNKVPLFWKWISDREVVFTYNGSFNGRTV